MNTNASSPRPRRSRRALSYLFGALAATGALLAVIYIFLDMETADLDEAARRQAPGDFIAPPDGVTHYEFGGPEDGPIVVLVHGFSVPYYMWDPTAEALRSAGYRVLRYDLFGRGYSDRPKAAYDLNFFSKQLDDLLLALNIEEPVHVGGLSMGGPIAAAFANRRPQQVRSLILIDPLIFPPKNPLAKVVEPPGVGEYLMTTVLAPFVMPQSQLEDFNNPERAPDDWVERYREQMQYKGFRRAALASVRNLLNKPVAMPEYEQVGKRNLPTLLLWGAEDKTIPREDIEQLRAVLPGVEFHVIEDAGHAPHYERPEVVNPLILEFLSKQS